MVVTRKSMVKIHARTAILAIDLSKKGNTALVSCGQAQPDGPFTFTHTRNGYQSLYARARRFADVHGCTELVVAFEPTGIYGIPLSHFFAALPVKLVQVNPLHTKKAKEITDNSPNKTDGKDVFVITDIVSMNRFLSVVIPHGIAAELRYLIHQREQLLEHQNALFSQLHDKIFMIFPEFLSIVNIRTVTACSVLDHCPAPRQVVALGLEGLTQVMRQQSHQRIGEETARRLLAAARTSVGITAGVDALVYSIDVQVRQITLLRAALRAIERQIKTYLAGVAESASMLSIPRIGPMTVAALIGEFADLHDFERTGEVMKFAGLNLYEISSGAHVGNRHIAKRGRALIRKFLYYSVLNMIRSGGIFHEPYRGLVARGMKKNLAIIAMMRKLLRIIVAVVRDKAAYTRMHDASVRKAA